MVVCGHSSVLVWFFFGFIIIHGLSAGVTGAEPSVATHTSQLVHRLAMGLRGVLAHPAPQLPASSVRDSSSSSL